MTRRRAGASDSDSEVAPARAALLLVVLLSARRAVGRRVSDSQAQAGAWRVGGRRRLRAPGRRAGALGADCAASG